MICFEAIAHVRCFGTKEDGTCCNELQKIDLTEVIAGQHPTFDSSELEQDVKDNGWTIEDDRGYCEECSERRNR